jgi:hypothetical protein
MSDQAFIYLIVALNALVQLMLIRSLNFPAGGKRKYYLSAIAIPALVMLSMRLLIAGGMIHERVADQSEIEQFITTAASVLLIAGPWLVTLAAILDKQRKGWVNKAQTGSREPE